MLSKPTFATLMMVWMATRCSEFFAVFSEGAETALVSAGENKRTTELLEVPEPGRSTQLAVVAASAEACRVVPADRAATAGELSISEFISWVVVTCMCTSCCPVYCSCLCTCLPRFFISCCVCCCCTHACFDPAWCMSQFVVGHGYVHRVPGGGRGSKSGVTSPAEDLRPVSQVEAGVNFRPGCRCTGAGCRSISQEGNQA